jgi:F420-dependent oxidoreductase-like protein
VRIAINFGAFGDTWEEAVSYALEAERLGVAMAWTAETWGYDSATPLAYLAARTTRLRLGTGIMQIGSRTPAMIAMTALALASLSHDRFLLGLGVSGPQVMEGWHGVRFARPLERTRETIDIIRMVIRGERLRYDGKSYQLPLPESEGKALVVNVPPRPHIPLYLATLGPKNLELTGELADGWLGTSFIPEHAALFFEPLASGAARSGRTLQNLDLQAAAGVVAFSDNVEQLIAPRKPGLAFTLGAMGSRQHNFYNEVYQRAGYAELAHEVQDLWLQGQRAAAAERIPDELVLKTNLIGTPDMVRERLRIYRAAGVTTLRVEPDGNTLSERLAVLEQLLSLVREVDNEAS